MAFKMKMKGFPKVTEGETKKGNEEFKARSAPVPGKGEYEGQMVDPRTGLPPGTRRPLNEQEVANADQIALLRQKMETVEPFSDEEEAIRQQIIKLRKPR